MGYYVIVRSVDKMRQGPDISRNNIVIIRRNIYINSGKWKQIEVKKGTTWRLLWKNIIRKMKECEIFWRLWRSDGEPYRYDDKVQPTPCICIIFLEAICWPLDQHFKYKDHCKTLIHHVQDLLEQRPVGEVHVFNGLEKKTTKHCIQHNYSCIRWRHSQGQSEKRMTWRYYSIILSYEMVKLTQNKSWSSEVSDVLLTRAKLLSRIITMMNVSKYLCSTSLNM